jgi:hypothetical protein
MLLNKKALANLSHIRWMSTQIKLLNVFSAAKTALAKQSIANDLYMTSRPELKPKSIKNIDKKFSDQEKEERRVSIDSLKTSASYGSDSILLNILALIGEVVITAFKILFFLPFQLLWNWLFKFVLKD